MDTTRGVWIPLAILGTVFATSVLSGIIGMAGGVVLMAVLVSVLSVPAAMLVHGAVQGTANGSRAWFLREHIEWHILPGYIAGAIIAVAAFVTVGIVASPGVVLIIIGLFPWFARLLPHLGGLSIMHRPTAVLCGVLVTSAQLLAGASGPLLDVFYLQTSLTRHQIIASKALTQTLGHVLKLGYYGTVIVATDTPGLWLFAVAIATAVAGTRVGTLILERVSEARFRSVSQYVILAIGAYCVVQGIFELSVS